MPTRITLKTVLDHIQGLRLSLENRMDKVEGHMDGLEKNLGGRMDRMEQRADRMERNLTTQIDGIDRRLDVIEDAVIGNRHDARIRRLEIRAGFRKARAA